MRNNLMYGINGVLTVKAYKNKYSYVRFLNICRAHNIELWNIIPKFDDNDNTLIFKIHAQDFKNVARIAKKTGIRLKVIKKSGLPFILPTLKRFSWLWIIMIAICATIIYSSNFVWAMEYVGNIQVSDDELNDFFVGIDITYGIKKDKIDCEYIEKLIRDRFSNIIWTSVYLEGTKLFVSVKENEKPTPTVYDDILDIQTSLLYEATYKYSKEINRTYKIVYHTGNDITSCFLEVFGVDISNFGINKFLKENRNMNYETIRSRNQVRIFGNIYLPVYYGEICRKEYYVKYLTYTDDELERLLTQDLENTIISLQEKGIKVIEKNLEMVQNRDSMELVGNLVIININGFRN